jgi:cytoskeletal protein CcmA (bactofilin family)
MWRKEDGNPQGPEVSSGAANSTAGKPASGPVGAVSGKAPACVSQGIKIKGELTGSEDLFIDGIVDGKITLTNSTLTVGPNATVKAEIIAKELVVRGRAEGKFTASERVQIWHTARVQGDIKSERISIEEGAQLQGKLEAGKQTAGASGDSQQNKKSEKAESSKSKETHLGGEKATSGAASAGAD